jgi:hypothetical protein
MPTLSYVHQHLSVDTCQTSLHALRWKERPLQCLLGSEPCRRCLGHVPRPTKPATLLASWLPAYLTYALCPTGVLAVAVVAVSDLG